MSNAGEPVFVIRDDGRNNAVDNVIKWLQAGRGIRIWKDQEITSAPRPDHIMPADNPASHWRFADAGEITDYSQILCEFRKYYEDKETRKSPCDLCNKRMLEIGHCRNRDQSPEDAYRCDHWTNSVTESSYRKKSTPWAKKLCEQHGLRLQDLHSELVQVYRSEYQIQFYTLESRSLQDELERRGITVPGGKTEGASESADHAKR